jgi:hypothetical protein
VVSGVPVVSPAEAVVVSVPVPVVVVSVVPGVVVVVPVLPVASATLVVVVVVVVASLSETFVFGSFWQAVMPSKQMLAMVVKISCLRIVLSCI